MSVAGRPDGTVLPDSLPALNLSGINQVSPLVQSPGKLNHGGDREEITREDSLRFSSSGCASLLAAQNLSPEVQKFVKVDAPVIALTHVRVIDGTGAAAREDQTCSQQGQDRVGGRRVIGEGAEGRTGGRSAWIQRDSRAGWDARPHVLSDGERGVWGDGIQLSATLSGGRSDHDPHDGIAGAVHGSRTQEVNRCRRNCLVRRCT